MRSLLVLGSTGTIGVNTLDVAAGLPERFQVVALSARRSAAKIVEQAIATGARFVALEDESAADEARRALVDAGHPDVRVFGGEGAGLRLVRECDADVIVQATVGAAALHGTLAALDTGRVVALANKEALVMAGPILLERARASGATLVPVDSEHSAIYQCLRAGRADEVERLILTSSGGALRDHPLPELATVTAEQALRHPNWAMGPRITIDSATMMNKALEVCEAVVLFDVPPERVQVVQHHQSIVHSMVEFRDGSVMAQLSRPDMRLPILFALAYPDRPTYPAVRFDVREYAKLTFADPDPERYPALELGFRAARAGGAAGAVLNAADEVVVEQFLAGELAFPEISRRVGLVLDEHLRERASADADLATIEQADAWARRRITDWEA